MCGICGLVSFSDWVDKSTIFKMNNAIKHRGPDDEGFVALNSRSGESTPLAGKDSQVSLAPLNSFAGDADVFLAHRRLSIVDTTVLGHQPMGNREKDLWITFNGEIYNYVEIRKELLALGYSFESNTDTEVLLAAYREWGKEFVTKLNGMWSFVLYDERKKLLFGSRDRFGVKPFYYYLKEGIFAFSSEAKSFFQAGVFPCKINNKALFDYFLLGWEEEPFLEDILELPPSSSFVLSLEDENFRVWQYYTLSYKHEWESFQESQCEYVLGKVKELIFSAVSSHLMSDVPVGACLSGGVDSSVVVCSIAEIMKAQNCQQIGDRLKTFTACYDDSKLDESSWAASVSDFVGSEWHRVYPSEDGLVEDLKDFVYCQDFPFGSTSMYAEYCVMRLARENGITVLLNGQGADEYFSGYTSYYPEYFYEMFRNRAFGSLFNEMRNMRNAPIPLRNVLLNLAKKSILNCVPSSLRDHMLNKRLPALKYMQDALMDVSKDSKSYHSIGVPKGSLNAFLFQRMSGKGLQSQLRSEDRSSMHFSVETRPLFADDLPLIEYVFSLPSSYKIKDGWSKYLLRNAMKGVLPENVRTRVDKIGYATPMEKWLCSRKDDFLDYFSGDVASYIDVGAIKESWRKSSAGEAQSLPQDFWRFLNFAIWYDLFLGRSSCRGQK